MTKLKLVSIFRLVLILWHHQLCRN